MKKLSFLLLIPALILLLSISVSAQVYDIDGKATVFLSGSETVTYNGTQYAPYAALGEALTALSETGKESQAIVVGDYHMSDYAGDKQYTMPISSLTIKGADENAIFNQYNWLEFYTGAVTIDNITWNGKASKGLIAKDLHLTSSFKTSGSKQYIFGYEYSSPVDSVKMKLDGGTHILAAALYGTTTVGTADAPGSIYMEINGGKYENYVFAGGNSGKSTVNGNIFLVLNGGTFNTSAIDNISFYNLNSVTGKKIAIVNNGLYDTVKPYGYDILVSSAAGGKITVDESTLTSTSPVLILTPDENTDNIPLVNGKSISKTDGVYTLTLTDNGTYDITWAKMQDGMCFIDGKATVFLSNSETVTYDGIQHIPYASLGEALTALSETGTDAQAIVVGDYHMSDNTADKEYTMPIKSLTIRGADENAIFNQYNWLEFYTGPVTIDNITWNGKASKGLIAKDLHLTSSVKTSGNKQYLFGYEYKSPVDSVKMKLDGGTHILAAALYGTTTVGTADAPGSIYMEINGGKYENYVFAGGNSGKSTVNGNIFLVLNGGTFNTSAIDNISFYNLNSVTGKKIAIVNNGLYATVKPYDADILVTSAVGGTVTVDESTLSDTSPVLILTPDENTDNIPLVNGKAVSETNGKYLLSLTDNGTYEVVWQAFSPQSYIIDGVKTVFLSNASSVTENGENYIPYSSLTEAFAELGVEGGRAIVCDDFTPADTSFSDTVGRGRIELIGQDRFAVFTHKVNLDFRGGALFIDSLTVKVPEEYTYMGGVDITLGENVTTSSDGAGRLYVTAGISARNIEKARVTVNSGTFGQLGAGGEYSGFVIGSPEKRGSSVVTVNGGVFSNSYFMAGGAYRDTTVYGNVIFAINGGTFESVRSLLDSQLKKGDENSRVIVLFNGTGPVITTDCADIVINSTRGGSVTLDDATANSTSPEFVLTPNENMVPFVNGTRLTAQNGEYRITADGTEETIDIVWYECFDVSFDLNGGKGDIPESINVIAGQMVSLPSDEGFSKADSTFIGWNTDKNATVGINTLANSEKNILYAIWHSTAPKLSKTPNLEVNGVSTVEITVENMTEAEKENAVTTATSDPVFMGSAAAEYVFKVTAFDENGSVCDFENGIDLVIPKEIYTFAEENGKFLKLYCVSGDTANEISDFSFTDEGLLLTAYNSGVIAVVSNVPDTAELVYTVKETDGNVEVSFYHSKTVSQSGFFGISYEGLKNAVFTYAEGITSAGGSTSDGGFGICTNDDGIFFDAWELETENGSDKYLDGTGALCLIGTLTLEKSENAYVITQVTEPEKEISSYTFGKGLLHLPYCESSETRFQPVNVRKASTAYVGCTPYDSLSDAIVASSEGDVVTLTEDTELKEDITLKDGTTLVLSGDITGGKIKLSESTRVVSEKNILSAFVADTLVAYSFDGSSYEYTASPYNKDYIALDGAQVRISGSRGLRFIAKLKDNADENPLYDYGFIVIPEELSENADTTHETELIAEISRRKLEDGFKYFEKNESDFSFTVCITDIASHRFNVSFVARPYVKYEKDGIVYTAYAEYDEKYILSLYGTAKGILSQYPDYEYKEELLNIISQYDEYIK